MDHGDIGAIYFDLLCQILPAFKVNEITILSSKILKVLFGVSSPA